MRVLTRELLIISILAILSACHSQDKPRILIIGDSISIGYTPFTKDKLTDKAMVFHNPGNAQHTGTGLKKIDEWIGNDKWDIIQFNWGLWDLCYRHPDSKVQGNRDKENGEITYTIDEYETNLDSIVAILQKSTAAKLVFATTTYIPQNEAGRFQNDAIKYNDTAKRVMKKHSVTVNDIYDQSISIHKEFGKGADNVHYSKKGYEKLGALVAKFLLKEIDSYTP